MKSQVRIIGGHWRGRKLTVVDAPGLRPTPDRIRETLFNWLAQDCRGALVLDCFAGSGALGFEALSRSAQQLVMLEQQPQALAGLRADAEPLQSNAVEIIAGDAQRSIARLRQRFDIVIIDPPTNQRGSFVAEKQYGQVLKRLPDFCAPGAQVIACLNSPFLNADFLTQQMARWCPDCRFCEYLPVSADFPDQFPDRGLKIVRFNYN